jgi:cysteinyl-tRNA synthetase
MSKSIGNIVSLREALETWGRGAILVFFLGAQYRSPVEYVDAALESARAQADSFRTAFRVAASRPSAYGWDDLADALDDDFDTPRALAILHDWRAAGQPELLSRGLAVFGLEVESADEVPAVVHELAERRQAARAGRDFGEADRLRGEIADHGWEVQDVAGEPGFRLVRRS